MDFVAVDIGASNTRYVSIDGKVNIVDNNMYVLPNMNTKVDVDKLDSVIENNIDISIWKDGESQFFPVRALVGSYADRADSANIRPTNMQNKVDQQVNYVSVVLAVALSKYKNGEIGDAVNLFLALPPSEVSFHKEAARKNLVGKYTVAFNGMNDDGSAYTMEFSIKDILCVAESRLAILQFLMDPKHPNRMSEYGNHTLLSFDIGASTTDLVLIKNGKFYDKGSYTIKIGGNNVLAALSPVLNASVGRHVAESSLERYLVEGRAQRGASYQEIGEEIDTAKDTVARSIINELPKYFNNTGIAIDDIAYIIVSGGGSMDSGYITEDGTYKLVSPSISVKIAEHIKSLCPGVEVVHYGDEPRLANIKGLGMTAFKKNGEIG